MNAIMGRTGLRLNTLSQPAYNNSNMDKQLPLKILLAEDHVVNQKIALLMLKRLGYRADIAGNGLEVLEALKRQSYDVVLMDIQMPQMNGIEATQRLRELEAESKLNSFSQPLRIIAMTANTMQSTQAECFAAGMNDYISKPIAPEELARALSACKSTKSFVPPTELNNSPLNPAAIDSDSVLEPKAIMLLREMAGKDSEGFIGELVACYLSESPILLEKIKDAIANHDITTIHRIAHTLKSSSATLGATTLTELCRQLENNAKDFSEDALIESFTSIQTQYNQVKIALEKARK